MNELDIKAWGIVDYEHRQTLLNEIKQLVRSQQIEEGDTEYLLYRVVNFNFSKQLRKTLSL